MHEPFHVTLLLQVAHMSKSELSHLDVTLFVPLAFFVNAYMSLGVPEYYILLLSLVSQYVDLNIFYFIKFYVISFSGILALSCTVI